MASPQLKYAGVIESRFPGLHDKIRQAIHQSEDQYQGTPDSSGSFLWEHSTHVASLAHRLAQAEHVDPMIPVIAALLHDAGKFAGGRYHEDGSVEEEESARIAGGLLREAGMKPVDIEQVIVGLKALYNEKAGKNVVADFVHDADLLSKFGALGVASFFVKSALRGRTLGAAVFQHLSKELTYAACLPANMRTAAGRTLATKKARDSLRFFRGLLDELRDAQIANLKIRRIRVAWTDPSNPSMEVLLVHPPVCPACGGRWVHTGTAEQGVKCRKLSVEIRCRRCGDRSETSFCLPEIVSVGNSRMDRE
jgi:HD superfamily phosphodiesterase